MILSNWFKNKKSSDKKPWRNHLEKVCKSNLQMMISLDGSFVTYRSIFRGLVNGKKSHFLKIDTLLPKDGDMRLKPHTDVTISYDYEKKSYRFNSRVLQKGKDAYPFFLITAPESINAVG